MAELLKAGLIGCGDYLRWEIDDLNNNRYLKVKSTYDLDKTKSEKIANKISAKAVDTVDKIYNDPEIKVVLIFTPPWVRKDLFRMAVSNGKHIITTKPFGSNLDDARELYDIVNNRVNCSVFYGRTGDDRVHYGIQQLITSKGWYITEEEIDSQPVIKAVKEKEIKTWEVEPLPYTKYDLFSINLQEGKPQPSDVRDAIIDMEIMDAAVKQESDPVEYVLTAEDGSTNTYTVIVEEEIGFLSYGFEQLLPPAYASISGNDLTVKVLEGTPVDSLYASFVTTAHNPTVKIGDDVQVSGVSLNDFTNPVVYTLDDGNKSVNYTVTVMVID